MHSFKQRISVRFKLFNTRIKKLFSTKIPWKKDDTNVPTNNKVISNKKIFLFLRLSAESHSQLHAWLVNVYNIGYRCINKLNKFIKVHKDKKVISGNNNVIYKIQDVTIVTFLMWDRQKGNSIPE